MNTERIGRPISYDAELADWDTPSPIGSVALTNCSCGTTLALSTQDMPLSRRVDLLRWVKDETQRRGVSPNELLDYLRDEVRRQVLDEGGQREP